MFKKNDTPSSRKLINAGVLSLVAILVSCSLVILAGAYFTFPPSEINSEIFLPDRNSAFPTERIWIYRFGVIFCIFFAFLLIYIFRGRLDQKEELFSNIASNHFSFQRWLFLDIAVVLFIGALLFIPDRAGLSSVIFSVDKYYHLDAFVAAPAWASLHGEKIYVDTFSAYGFGLPIVVGWLANLIGGLSYESILTVILWAMIFYFTLFYVFMRCWVRNIYICIFAVLLFIKLQVFNLNPFMLIYPSRTILRLFFDLFFFLFLWLYRGEIKRQKFLWLAALVSGISIFYVTDLGFYIYVTFLFYLFILYLNRPLPVVYKILMPLIPLVSGFFLISLFAGAHVFSAPFWNNFFGFLQESLSGFGMEPFLFNLADKKYLEFLLGLIVPLVYLFIFVIIAACHFLNFLKGRRINISYEQCLVLTFCVYGLLLYHYYLWRPVGMNYFVVSMPLVVLICLGISKLEAYLTPRFKSMGAFILLLVAFGGILLTENIFKAPNVFNFSRYSFDDNKFFLTQELNLEKDVTLVQSLTSPEEKVCLISSFETLILMKAQRAPFFYRAQFLKSSYFNVKDFQGTFLTTKKDLARTWEQLRSAPPPYIFIEKKILLGLKEPNFLQPSLLPILKYILSEYSFSAEGKYLIAMKRNIN